MTAIETNTADSPAQRERLFKQVYRAAWREERARAEAAEAQLRALNGEPEPQSVDVETMLAGLPDACGAPTERTETR